jgi:hypothetical protein
VRADYLAMSRNGSLRILVVLAASVLWSACAQLDDPELANSEHALFDPFVTIPVHEPFAGPRPTLYEVYGATPNFQVNLPGFDSLNRAYVRERTAHVHEISGELQRMRFGAWNQEVFEEGVREALGGATGDICYSFAAGEYSAQIVFDRDDRAYTVAHARVCASPDPSFTLVMAYSTDFGTTWHGTVLPYATQFALERPHSPEALEGPPAVLLWDEFGTYRDPRCEISYLGGYGALSVVKPYWQQQTLTYFPEVLISSEAMHISSHSGGGTMVLTSEDEVYVAWTDAVEDPPLDPEEPGVEDDYDYCPARNYGSPVMMAVYDGASGMTETQRQQLPALSKPTNDGHNRPAIVMDTFEKIHVVVGSHNCSFQYLKASLPRSVHSLQWSAPIPTVSGTSLTCPPTTGGHQSYVALVRDRDDRLHLAYREFDGDDPSEPDPNGYYLVYQSKTATGSWSPRDVLVQPPHSPYSIYYHQLTIDRYGHLYLLLSYYTYRTDTAAYYWFEDPVLGIYEFSTMLTSVNAGGDWQWATTTHFDSATLWTPASGAIGDIDGNGLDDVVHVYWDHGLNVHVDGSFDVNQNGVWDGWTSRGRRLTDGPGVLQFPVLVGDVNEDGRDDLVFVYRHWSSPYQLVIRTHFSQPDGTFSGVTSDQGDPTGIPDPAYRPLIGDVTGDGKADVVLMWRAGSCLHVRTKIASMTGDGTWGENTTCLSDGTKVHQYPTRLGYVNDDLRADLVFVYREGGFLYTRVKYGNANGTFSNGPQQQHNDGPGVHQYPHVLGDVDGDGLDDLVFIFHHWSTGVFTTRVLFSQWPTSETFSSSVQASHSSITGIPDSSFETKIGRVDMNSVNTCGDLVFPYRPSGDGDYRLRTFRGLCNGQWNYHLATLP